MDQVYAFEGLVPVVDPTAFLHPSAVLIGDVIIGPACFIGPGAVMRGDMGRLILGKGSNLQDNCVVHGFPGRDTVVEENGHIGHGAVLHGCTIGRDALVGMHAVVMDGATIGEGAFVGALCFVPAGFEVPAGMLAVGVPARLQRRVTGKEQQWKAQGTEEYQALAQRYRKSLVPARPLSAPEPNRGRIVERAVRPLHQIER